MFGMNRSPRSLFGNVPSSCMMQHDVSASLGRVSTYYPEEVTKECDVRIVERS
jgi:hypothetical protein